MTHILAKFLSGTFTHYQIQYKVIDMLIVGVDNIKTVNMYIQCYYCKQARYVTVKCACDKYNKSIKN